MDTEVLGTALSRYELLEALANGQVEKRAIASETANSRSTVYRGIQDLAEVELVDTTGRAELTATGELVYDLLTETVEECSAVVEYEQLASSIAAYEEDNESVELLSRDIVESFSIVRREPSAPSGPVREFAEKLREADRVEGVLPTMHHTWAEAITELQSVSLRLPGSVVERYDTLWEDHREIEARRPSNPTQIGLCLFDASRISVLVYDDGGLVEHAHSTDSATVATFVDEVFDEP